MGIMRIGSKGLVQDGWFSATWTIGGRPRTFAPNRWVCLIVAGAVPLVAVWYLAATVYIVFHDQVMASLITRQTDMQYAYEDRISGLRTQLDREMSRGAIDHRILETTVHDLVERSALLESRSTIIDRLVARNARQAGTMDASDTTPARTSANQNPLLTPDHGQGLASYVRSYSDAVPGAVPSGDKLRLQGLSDDASAPNPSPRGVSDDKRSDLEAPVRAQPATSEGIALALSQVTMTQEHTLATLREPTLRFIARGRLALMEVGLPATPGGRKSRPVQDDVGGPFVQLPTGPGALSFEQNAALLQDAFAQADQLNAMIAKVPLRKPLNGPLEVTSSYGPRIDPFYGRPAMHTGIDFRETYGDGVRATAAGVVTIAGSEGGYGTMVEVDHGNGLATRYAHLSSVSVTPGQKVAVGAVIGHVGSTGRATGPHLHYETRINGEPVDPTRFLRVGARLYEE